MKRLSLALIIFVIIFCFVVYTHAPKVGSVDMGLLPNKTLTPGSINPNVTQANIQQTICKSGWTATIRPPSNYTTSLKKFQLGLSDQIVYLGIDLTLAQLMAVGNGGYKNIDNNLTHFEEDHLISLELGGHPTSPQNLWPESYITTPNAHQKDQVENELKREVCNGTLTLKQAQIIISTDWVGFYRNKLGVKFGATSDLSNTDD